jgi:hypothetical protein
LPIAPLFGERLVIWGEGSSGTVADANFVMPATIANAAKAKVPLRKIKLLVIAPALWSSGEPWTETD